LVQSCTSIFTLPEIYFRVREVVDDSNSTMEDLAEILKLDPAISARLLRIVNSPIYGFPKQIDTISRTVSLLGTQAIIDLVTATTVGKTFAGVPIQLMDVSKFWHRSVLCALLAGKIAKSCGIQDSERFFVEGLLRDLGHYVLYQYAPERAQSALIEAGYLDASLAEVEQSNIGCDFAEVGAELVRSWGMPIQIEQAIRHQLSPDEAGDYVQHASIVHLAGEIVDYEERDPKRRPAEVLFHPQAMKETGFVQTNLPELLRDAQIQLKETLALVYPQALAA
ncbi:MAG TPA: HDOD domain-containing protein, partial [Nitrospira sp.]|nr:HDOD domain-containing protein [Nitrospira sp.]